MMSAVRTLYLEELRATMRGRFAWLGAAAILLAVGGLSVASTQEAWLDGYGIIAYCLVPLGFIPFAAGTIASARANRFVESLFTAPVDRRDWLMAKVLVLLTFATAYYAALLPMLVVYTSHVGVPFILGRLLVWAPGLLVASIAVGTLVGVLFIGRNIAAPAATGMGVLLAYGGLLPLQELMVAQSNGATATGHLALASPAVLLKNALGFALVAGTVPSTTARTWLCFAVIVGGSLALAAWVFLRAQGVETWEASPSQRWTIVAGLVTIAVFPSVFADVNYDKAAPRRTNAPAVRGVGGPGGRGATGSLGLSETGRPLPGRCCGPILNRDTWPPLATGTASVRDLFVLLPVESSQAVSDLRIDVTGEGGLTVAVDPNAARDATGRLETRAYGTELGPTAPDGHRISTGWVARVPVTLTPTNPWDIGGMRYPLAVSATYQVAGEDRPRTLKARAAVEAHVARAVSEMGAVAIVMPLMCLGAAFARWRRTR